MMTKCTTGSSILVALAASWAIAAPAAMAGDADNIDDPETSDEIVVVLADDEFSDGDDSDANETNAVVVTGTRTARQRQESPVPIDVIDGDAIEASGARTIAEVLRAEAGVEIVDSLGGATIRMQGLSADYVQILIDGQPLAGRIDGAIDLDRLGTSNVARVEILRGAGSTLYGADALGGVINIITEEPREALRTEADISYGQRNTLDVGARVSTRRPDWSAQTHATFRRHDGYDLEQDTPFTTGSALGEFQGGLAGKFEATESVVLRGDVEYMQRRQHRVDSGASRAVFDRRNTFEHLRSHVGADIEATKALQITTRLSYEQFRNQFFYDQRQSTALDRYEDSREHQLRLDGQGQLAIGDHQVLTFGIESALLRLDSDRLRQGQGQRQRLAAYVQDEIFVGPRGELSIVPGIRLDLDSQYGVHPSPRLAARWQIVDDLTLRASAARGFRAPSFQELLLEFENPSAGYVIAGNPDLAPETSYSFQGGAMAAATEWLELEINLFWNELDNLIATTTLESGGVDEPLQFGYDNIDSAFTAGLESSVAIEPRDGWVIDGGYTWTETYDRRADRALEGRPRHSASLALRAEALPLGLQAGTRARWTGQRPYYTEGTQDLEQTEWAAPYLFWDAHLARDFGDHFSAFIRGTNLLNAGDLRHLPIAPRTLFAGIRAAY